MTATARQLQCLTLLEAQGYSSSGAAALVGNFSIESGPSLPTAFRTGKLDHGSQGLAQWRAERLTAYQDYVRSLHPELIEDGMSDADVVRVLWPWFGRMSYQVQFVKIEMARSYSALHRHLVEGGDVATLAAAVCWQYERPNRALSHIAERIAYARTVVASARGPGEATSFVDMPSALAAEAGKHAQTRNGGIATAGAAAIGGAALIGAHVANYLAWWEWGLLAALTGVIGVGVASAFKAGTDANSVKAAIAGIAAAPQLAMKPGTAPPVVPIAVPKAPPVLAPSPMPSDPLSHTTASAPPVLPTVGLGARMNAMSPGLSGAQPAPVPPLVLTDAPPLPSVGVTASIGTSAPTV